MVPTLVSLTRPDSTSSPMTSTAAVGGVWLSFDIDPSPPASGGPAPPGFV